MVSLQPGLNIQALKNKDVDAVATVYQSSVPYLLADNVPYEIMFFSAHGVDIYSLTFITPAEHLQASGSQVKSFVEGAMEGLKFSYLNPQQTWRTSSMRSPRPEKRTATAPSRCLPC
jgi:hypothetical protein